MSLSSPIRGQVALDSGSGQVVLDPGKGRRMAGRHRSPVRRNRAEVSPRRQTDDSEYTAMLLRMFLGYARRVSDDPAALADLKMLRSAFDDLVKLGHLCGQQAGR